jgi:hypothetical protein
VIMVFAERTVFSLARTSQEGGSAPAVTSAGARFACPLPYLFSLQYGLKS